MVTIAFRAGRGAAVAVTAATALVTLSTACAQASQAPAIAGNVTAAHRAVPTPAYYATLIASQAGNVQVVVHVSATGAITGRLAVPSNGDSADASITASPDGRAFVVGAATNGPGAGFTYRLFRFVLLPGGVPTPLAPLRTAITLSRAAVRGIALSPDESKVAVSIEHFAPSVDTVIASGVIDVVDVASGTVRSWTSPGTGYWAGQPSWMSDTAIAFPWWRVTFVVLPRLTQQLIAIDELNIAAPGSLLGGKPTAIPVSGGVRSAVLTSDGRFAVLAACQVRPGPGGLSVVTARVSEVTVRGGQLVRVLRTQTASYPAGDASAILDQSCAVMSADPSGQHVLVNVLQPGRIDNGAFTALPAVPAGSTLRGAAW